MKLKIFLIRGILLAFVSTIDAQSYGTGIGVRTGLFYGITAKKFIAPTNAVEGIVNFRWDGVIVTGLYEWQNEIPYTPGFDYVLGVGAHIGFFNNYKWDKDKSAVVGVDIMVGAEYTFPTAPFTIGLDYKPAFNFIGDNHIWADGWGLSFRFTLK